jgi:hypothetical protein
MTFYQVIHDVFEGLTYTYVRTGRRPYRLSH